MGEDPAVLSASAFTGERDSFDGASVLHESAHKMSLISGNRPVEGARMCGLGKDTEG
jgi:hypothetical protein